MNMPTNDPRHPWARLTAAARRVGDERDASAPYGFATRVVALAQQPERAMRSLLERFSLRAVGIAALVALLGVAMNYQAITAGQGAHVVTAGQAVTGIDEIAALTGPDAVFIVLDIGD